MYERGFFPNEIYRNRSLWQYVYSDSFLMISDTFGHSVVEQYFTVAKLLNGVILALVCRVCLLCLTNHSVYCQFSWALLAVFKINEYHNLQKTLLLMGPQTLWSIISILVPLQFHEISIGERLCFFEIQPLTLTWK